MPIVSADLQFRLSGGAANADPNVSLGGAESSTVITTAVLNNLFDDVAGSEATAGDVEYRMMYLHNNHGTLAAQNPKVHIQQVTPSADTVCAIGYAVAGVGATETAVADESTAPAGVTFTSPVTAGTAIVSADVPAGSFIGLWIRRTVSAAAAALALDNVVIRWTADTAP